MGPSITRIPSGNCRPSGQEEPSGRPFVKLEKPDEEEDSSSIWESFPDEQLFAVASSRPWFADIANYVASGIMPLDLSSSQKKRFLHDCKEYYWDEPYLFKQGVDQIFRRCIPEEEVLSILTACHDSPYGGHYSGERTAFKVLQSGFFWPSLFKDAYLFAKG